MRTHLLLALILVGGCATKTKLIPVEYQFVDNPVDRRIDLTYLNSSRNTMCLSPEEWPNLGGKINQASDKVFLIVGGEQFPVEDFNTGYCFGGCALRVAPNMQTSAKIPYADFRLPDHLINEPKKLEFSPVGTKCRAKK